jgi:hypothetical protein
MIKMFKQIIAFAAEYTTTLFILMISAMIFLSVFWAKTGVYRK